MKPKILKIESMARGASLDDRCPGEVVSFAGTLDGEECCIVIDKESYGKIVRNIFQWAINDVLKQYPGKI